MWCLSGGSGQVGVWGCPGPHCHQCLVPCIAPRAPVWFWCHCAGPGALQELPPWESQVQRRLGGFLPQILVPCAWLGPQPCLKLPTTRLGSGSVQWSKRSRGAAGQRGRGHAAAPERIPRPLGRDLGSGTGSARAGKRRSSTGPPGPGTWPTPGLRAGAEPSRLGPARAKNLAAPSRPRGRRPQRPPQLRTPVPRRAQL